MCGGDVGIMRALSSLGAIEPAMLQPSRPPSSEVMPPSSGVDAQAADSPTSDIPTNSGRSLSKEEQLRVNSSCHPDFARPCCTHRCLLFVLLADRGDGDAREGVDGRVSSFCRSVA